MIHFGISKKYGCNETGILPATLHVIGFNNTRTWRMRLAKYCVLVCSDSYYFATYFQTGKDSALLETFTARPTKRQDTAYSNTFAFLCSSMLSEHSQILSSITPNPTKHQRHIHDHHPRVAFYDYAMRHRRKFACARNVQCTQHTLACTFWIEEIFCTNYITMRKKNRIYTRRVCTSFPRNSATFQMQARATKMYVCSMNI